MNSDDFFSKCQEPVLLRFYYELGWAHFLVELYDNNEILKIKVKTHYLCSNFNADSQHGIAVFTPCIEDLTERLCIKNGVYIPSQDFVSLMDEVRYHLNLAYGLRCSQYQKMVRFYGAFTLAFIPEGEWIFEQ